MKKKLSIVFFSFFLLFCASCCIFNKDGKYIRDNPTEEMIEEYIKNKTGIDVEFTPDPNETMP